MCMHNMHAIKLIFTYKHLVAEIHLLLFIKHLVYLEFILQPAYSFLHFFPCLLSVKAS